MTLRKHKRLPIEFGQATLEAAILIPIAVVLVLTVFDMGRCFMLAGDLQSAADGAARSIEASSAPAPDAPAVIAEAARAYPNFSGRVTASVDHSAHEVDAIDYKLYNPATGAFKSRPSHVGRDRYEVTLRYTGEWLSPVMTAISSSTGSSQFVLEARSTATIDTTLEEW